MRIRHLLVVLLSVSCAGVDELIAACKANAAASPVLIFIATASGSGATIAFGPWAAWSGNPLVGAPTNFITVKWVTPPPGSTHLFLGIGTELTEFSAGGGGLTAVHHLLPAWMDHLSFGHIYPASTSAHPDLVGDAPGPPPDFLPIDATVRVLSWTGSAYVQQQALGTADAVPIGVISKAAGAPGDVLIGRPGALVVVPLINDGTGHLR